ncbi:hypothetical protein QFC20_001504 [Naganishia adeliensis]|uniref:Uncharacterized protein n=1 Tax=Naganishia adeliensis TaxID=92952 RepID=A0ACC2WTD2_9TREE|nr:hypothetical protein QFC20_001504 [Naganishia adeliensis]
MPDPSSPPCTYTLSHRYIHTESGLPLTIRYIGPLPAPPSADDAPPPTWIGVEWDDPARGKHSGTFRGGEVFRTRLPGAGSFLKWKPCVGTSRGEGKKSVLSAGKGFFQAVYERYIDAQLPSPTTPAERNSKVESIVLGSSNGAITVEMPNIDKVVHRLRRGVADPGDGGLAVKEVGLEGQWVRGLDVEDGPWMNLRGKLNNVSTLNLSRNLIPTWHSLAALCAELPTLQVLVINYSRFEPLHRSLAESLPEHLRTAFQNINELHICNSLLTWTEVGCSLPTPTVHQKELILLQVLRFTDAFPSLRTLDLAGNPILSINGAEATPAGRTLRALENLDLTACGVDTWEALVEVLLQMPDLRALNISSNPVQIINISPTCDLSRLPTLGNIILNDTQITDWQSIDHLQTMFGRTLRTFKYSLSPSARSEGKVGKTFTGTMDDRVYLIAKLPALETLNGTLVTQQERTDAERFYLAQAAKALGATDEAPGWGRLKELTELHGESQSGVSKHFLPTTLKSKMVDITVECPDLGVDQFTLSLLPTAPIKLLKTKIARQLGVPINSDFGLSVREVGNDEPREVGGDDRANVGSLELGEGDVVLVEVR